MGPRSRGGGGGLYPLVLSSLLTAYTMGNYLVQDKDPEFLAPLENHTVSQGRDVTFTCVVDHLGPYKVAWIKADTKAILGIHNLMVAHNPRLSVTHNGHNTWRLKIAGVESCDSGEYMCQINTVPMRHQLGHLEVVIPPDIISEESSGDGVALEGGLIRLRCKATGKPEPIVIWRRENSRNIILRHESGREKQAVQTVEGEILSLTNVQRSDMGNYLCIAKNGYPPMVSKRFVVSVQFHPLIKMASQLIAAPMGSDVVIQCYVEAAPRAMNSWHRAIEKITGEGSEAGEKLVESAKYEMSETPLNEYSLVMNLTIRTLEQRDFGGYVCASSNALGRHESKVRLQELHLTPQTTIVPVSSHHVPHEPGREVSHKRKGDKKRKIKPKDGNEGGSSGGGNGQDGMTGEFLSTPASSLEPRYLHTGVPGPGSLPGYPTRQPMWVPHHNAAVSTMTSPRLPCLWPHSANPPLLLLLLLLFVW